MGIIINKMVYHLFQMSHTCVLFMRERDFINFSRAGENVGTC